jgi:hypothetical protein
MAMKKLLFILLAFEYITAQGQDLLLQHRTKSNKTKKIHIDRAYKIKTNDAVFYSKIIKYTDSTLFVRTPIKAKDTTAWTYDTIPIKFTDIKYLKFDWFPKREWLVPSVYLSFCAVGSVLFLPLAAAEDGKKGINDWLAFEGILVTFGVIPVFIGTCQTKYDLQKKWKFSRNRVSR